MKKAFFLFVYVWISIFGFSQDIQRPSLYGIAKMTYYISSFDLAAEYYGTFLGFEKAFSYSSAEGLVHSYKVNDRQFLEFIEDKEFVHQSRLVSVSFETDNALQMRDYLLSKGIQPVKDLFVDGAGNKVLLIHDPSGIPIEFIEYTSGSLHSKSKTKYLSERRIATRIHHAGLFTRKMEDNPLFYTEILGFKRVLRFPTDESEPPRILYFRIPESAEMIEHYPTEDINFNHPCFVTMDIQETFSILRERQTTESLGIPSIGMGKRWLLNLSNSDGLKVEFTEPYISVF